jgi:hypothetical protein
MNLPDEKKTRRLVLNSLVADCQIYLRVQQVAKDR